MKRFTISKLACSMAFAMLLNSNATAQSGGSFAAPPVPTGSFSNGQVVNPVQNLGTPSQFGHQGSQFGGFKPNLPQPIAPQASSPIQTNPTLTKPSGFNPMPFKVTGSNSASKPRPTNSAALSSKPTKNMLSSGSSSSNKAFPSKPSPPVARTAGPTSTPASMAGPARLATQGQTSFGAHPTSPVQIASSESSGGANPPPNSVDCPISSVHFMDDILLPAKEPGEIQTLNFKEGDFVPAGQIIAQINDDNYQLLLQQADMRYQIALDAAGDSTATLAAKKKYQVASIEAKKTDRLAGTGSKSASDKMMATYSKEIAYLEMQKAEQDRKKALAEARLARQEKIGVEAKIARHTLRSDFDGYVIEIKKHKQEYVQLGEEVLRLARMDRVWVQSVVDTKELNAHELMNKKVTVTINLARDETAEFEGVVKFVGLERQGPELLMVKAEVINRPINSHWILHPEAEVSMTIHLNDESSSSSSLGTASMPSFTH